MATFNNLICKFAKTQTAKIKISEKKQKDIILFVPIHALKTLHLH